jgi:hypothetical protein
MKTWRWCEGKAPRICTLSGNEWPVSLTRHSNPLEAVFSWDSSVMKWLCSGRFSVGAEVSVRHHDRTALGTHVAVYQAWSWRLLLLLILRRLQTCLSRDSLFQFLAFRISVLFVSTALTYIFLGFPTSLFPLCFSVCVFHPCDLPI